MVLKLNIHDDLKLLSERHHLIFNKRLFGEYYIFFQEDKHYKSKRSVKNLDKDLKSNPDIKWFDIQKELFRQKRDFNNENYNQLSEITSDSVNELRRIKNMPFNIDDKHFPGKISYTSNRQLTFNDPEWPNQWYVNSAFKQGFDLNITKAWSMGYSGRGVVISIIDDGIERNNIELIDNFDFKASYDLNDNDHDPMPRYDRTNENKHGTRCAGEIAAKANNSYCGVGVAFNARIGGIRLLDGKITDRLEAEALNFRLNYIDIFSASWGPLDDGKTVDGPGTLSKLAFVNGVNYGRKGKGTIYVWAAGNGGRFNDNCNCDGYTSSLYTITIGSVTPDGRMPVYSEQCSATLASTYSSGNIFHAGIITSDLGNGCTKHHTGTSASAPIGAGIIALVLEANSNLTWRDVQYLIIKTSSNDKLKAKDFRKNGVGKVFSHNFGYGLMNAGKMIQHAINWSLVNKQINCTVNAHLFNSSTSIKGKSVKSFWLNLNENSFKENNSKCDTNLKHLEHVVATLTIESGVRGQLNIDLLSPSQTRSNLLKYRNQDMSNEGFKSWPFMSVHFWGENPIGIWNLEITNNSTQEVLLKEWSLQLFGVDIVPKDFLENE